MHVSTGCFYLFFRSHQSVCYYPENKKKAQSCAFFRWVVKKLVFLWFEDEFLLIESGFVCNPDKNDFRFKFFGVENIFLFVNIFMGVRQKKERPVGPLFFNENIQRNNLIISEPAVFQ